MRKLASSRHIQNSIGTDYWWLKDSWWLNETKGASPSDKCILSILKISYLGLRILLRIALGKKRRDRLFIRRKINFKDFLYKAIHFLRLGNSMLLKISVPKYDYKFYCRINKEDFIIMTGHGEEVIEYFRPKEGDVVVDIGAHIGYYTIISSKRVNSRGKVVAIEAHPRNFEMLNRNIKLNKLTNITTLNYAVYSKETQVKLYLPDEELGYTIYNTIMSNRAKAGEKFVDVNANTLDNLLKQNGIREEQVNWIKIDVEGAEFEVLKGATNILSKSKDIALLIEVHGIENYKSIVEFLGSYNFKIEFEKSNKQGDWKHIVVRKSGLTT
jgi:FkbM family methyltransferase